MIVVLTVYAAGVFTFVRSNLSRTLDEQLFGDFQWAAMMADKRPDGSLTWFDADRFGGLDSPWLQVVECRRPVDLSHGGS